MSAKLLLALAPLFCAAQSASLSYSTFLGGDEYDEINAVAVGPDDSIYVAGKTSSKNFPARNAWQAGCALGTLGSCTDGFLARFSADGRELLFSTYYGTAANDQIVALAVDSEGNAVVAGNLQDLTYGFVARFAPDGRHLGENRFRGYPLVLTRGLSISGKGDIYVAGETAGLVDALPPGGYQPAVGPDSCQAIGGRFPLRAFVLRFWGGNLLLLGGTYFGGSGNSAAQAVAVGPDGDVWITGNTSSTDLPLVNAFQTDYRGGHSTTPGDCTGGDAFLARFSPDLSTLRFSTYHGGAGRDLANAVAVNDSGIVVFAGQTSSLDLYSTHPAQNRFAGASDAFLVKLLPDSSAASLSAYYGGSGVDAALAVRIDAQGDVYLSGRSSSADLPLVQPIQRNLGGCLPPQPYCTDAFVARWSAQAGIDFATLLGGSGDDYATSMVLTPRGDILGGGITYASDFPAVNAFQDTKGSPLTTDGMFFRLTPPPRAGIRVVSAASDSIRTVASVSLAAVVGSDLVQSVSSSPFYGFDFRPEGLTLEIDMLGGAVVQAPILFASPTRILFLVPLPPAAPVGTYSVRLRKHGEVFSSGVLTLANPSPAVFSANGEGSGAAAAVASDVGGGAQWEPAFSCSTAPASCATSPITASSASVPRVLRLYGTGFTSTPAQVYAAIGTTKVQVLSVLQAYAPGVHEITLALPPELNGRGRQPIQITAGGVLANTVEVEFK